MVTNATAGVCPSLGAYPCPPASARRSPPPPLLCTAPPSAGVPVLLPPALPRPAGAAGGRQGRQSPDARGQSGGRGQGAVDQAGQGARPQAAPSSPTGRGALAVCAPPPVKTIEASCTHRMTCKRCNAALQRTSPHPFPPTHLAPPQPPCAAPAVPPRGANPSLLFPWLTRPPPAPPYARQQFLPSALRSSGKRQLDCLGIATAVLAVCQELGQQQEPVLARWVCPGQAAGWSGGGRQQAAVATSRALRPLHPTLCSLLRRPAPPTVPRPPFPTLRPLHRPLHPPPRPPPAALPLPQCPADGQRRPLLDRAARGAACCRGKALRSRCQLPARHTAAHRGHRRAPGQT
jgi:hypothetical protein